MTDVQHACLTKIVVDGEILPFIESKIDTKFFSIHKHALVFDMVMEHYREYNDAPTADVIHRAYPMYVLDASAFPETTEYYLHQLQDDRKLTILTDTTREQANRLGQTGPHMGADLETIMRSGLALAAHEVTQGRDTDLFLSSERILARLMARRDNPGYLRGITTGIDGLDRITGGFRDEQLITFIGTPKTGKSSMLLKMALEARLAGAPVLFLTFEMSTEEQEDRVVSLISGVSLTKILTGMFNPIEQKSIEQALRLKESLAGFTITSDLASALTLSGVQAKIQQYQPKVVFVDGVYLMDDETGNPKGSPQALTSLTRGFKRLAQTRRLPIVISTQALLSRSGGGRKLQMDSVGYSSSFAQDSDVLLGTESNEHVSTLVKVKTIAQRSGPTGVVYMEFDWSQGLVQEIDANTYEASVAQAAPPVTTGAVRGP